MTDGLEWLQVGDLVKISCPLVAARVAEVDQHYAYVEWPWGEIDPASRFRWNGQRAFAKDPKSLDWLGSPFRTVPEPRHLRANDMCEVGIPDMIVQVSEILRFESPQDRGWLPRPRLTLGVIPADYPMHIDDEDAGDCLHFPTREPITVERAP
ncbi:MULTISPECIES: hypothetical protein [unclassified Streptomyces]|uniref:hypothetical protein n=1 Tax=Streptomyces sp. NPDC058108 TaxID=3346344 RepID=UPI0036E1E36E